MVKSNYGEKYGPFQLLCTEDTFTVVHDPEEAKRAMYDGASEDTKVDQCKEIILRQLRFWGQGGSRRF